MLFWFSQAIQSGQLRNIELNCVIELKYAALDELKYRNVVKLILPLRH
jgi:hypothetical protein